MLRSRAGVLERLLHHDGEPVLVRVAQTAPDVVLFGARAPSAEAARHGIERMRFALGVDEDLSAFDREFARDPLIGRSLRRRPWLRPRRRPEPFEALAWAICEQLIEYERAAAIQRRIVAAMGPRWSAWQSCERRACAMCPRRTCWPGPRRRFWSPSTWLNRGRACWCGSRARWRRGRLDLHGRRSRARAGAGCERSRVSGLGRWRCSPSTVRDATTRSQPETWGCSSTSGSVLSGGDPRACASEADVRSFFARYGPWQGLAAVHAGAI